MQALNAKQDRVKNLVVDIYGLSVKKHHYNFEVGDQFFVHAEDSSVVGGKLAVDLQLDKSETMIVVSIGVSGFVKLLCDRTLEEFDEPVALKEKLFFRYGETFEEVSDEVVLIPRQHQQIDFAPFVYDYTMLSLPVKKLHPRVREESAEREDDFLVYSTSAAESEGLNPEKPADEREEGEVNDPRWSKLKGLKFN